MKRTVRKRGDKSYTYLSLVESVHVDGNKTHQTLLRLGEVGELERSGQLDRIVAALSSYTDSHLVSADDLEAEGAPAFGAVAPIFSCVDRLGLREHFTHIGEARGSKNLADTVLVMVAGTGSVIRAPSAARSPSGWARSHSPMASPRRCSTIATGPSM